MISIRLHNGMGEAMTIIEARLRTISQCGNPQYESAINHDSTGFADSRIMQSIRAATYPTARLPSSVPASRIAMASSNCNAAQTAVHIKEPPSPHPPTTPTQNRGHLGRYYWPYSTTTTCSTWISSRLAQLPSNISNLVKQTVIKNIFCSVSFDSNSI